MKVILILIIFLIFTSIQSTLRLTLYFNVSSTSKAMYPIEGCVNLIGNGDLPVRLLPNTFSQFNLTTSGDAIAGYCVFLSESKDSDCNAGWSFTAEEGVLWVLNGACEHYSYSQHGNNATIGILFF